MARARRPESKALPFDLWNLQIFLTVCEHGGMGAAAKQLGLTQPAVSQAMAELEAGLGTKILDRSVRPLGLTPAGLALKQRAWPLLADAHQILPAIRDVQHAQLPLIRIGLADSLSRALAPTVSAFLSTRAREVSVVSGFTAVHAEALMNRNLDILVGIDTLKDIGWVGRYSLIEEPYMLIVPADMKGEIKSIRNLGDMHLIRYSEQSQTGRDIERYLRRMSVDLPRYQEFNTPAGVSAAVAAGHGWAITTPLCAFEGGLDRAIHYIQIPPPGFNRRIYLICRKREIGQLPRDLANVITRSLRDNVLPTIVGKMPWAPNQMRIATKVA